MFFPAKGYGHPPGGPPGINAFGLPTSTPNWFYYYSQVYPSDDVRYSTTGSQFFTKSRPWWDNYNVYLGDDAGGSWGLHLFELDGVTHKIKHRAGVDILHVRGIHNYVATLEHEHGHKSDYFNGILDNPIGSGDWDTDGLDNNWEIQHGFDPNKADTADAYNFIFIEPDNSGDAEASADIQAYGMLVGTRELWRQDWADWGSQNESNMQRGNPAYRILPWEYWGWNPQLSRPDEPPNKTYLRQHPYTP